MISTSTLYNNIFATQNHSVEWKITINGVDYGMDKIAADVGGGHALPHIHRQVFTGNAPSVGGCVSATFECSIFEASANVPRMATVVPKYRLLTEMQTSEWITLGTFYIDTRTVDEVNGILDLSCFDAMLKADGMGGNSYADVTGFDEWPQDMDNVVDEICSIIGVTLDSRTTIHSGTGYKVEYPNDLTMREVLGYIAVHHAGNFTITPAGKLRLVPLTGNSDTLNLGTNTAQLHTAPAFSAWSKVTVYWADEEAYEAGSTTGRELVCESPWATQETANGILSAISGTTYRPYNGTGSFIDLVLEVGDKVTVGYTGEEITSPAFTIDVTAEVLEVAGIAAEGEQEIDHEYPYADYVDRSLRRKVGLNTAYYGVTISRQKGLEIKRTDGASEALFNSDLFTMRALIDGVMKDRIYFDPIKGDYVFDGALGADAVFTDSLYAEQGDIAELTVDRLSTSRRVRKYILEDTSDDNYIQIQDNHQRFITGTAKTDELNPTVYLTEQATNRFGQGLYWQREPVSHNTQGYPLDEDGEQIYATTEQTNWPVMVYQYEELVKAEFAFEEESGTYVPVLTLGAGDNNGYTKGILHKSADGFDITFMDSDGNDTGIRMWSAGYMDLYNLRKPTEIDFSGWDNGYFSETLDGNITNGFVVDFDSQDRPHWITDGAGHETIIYWPSV